jgi:methylmalonyl-CoA mutase N-terminal domain/subunit
MYRACESGIVQTMLGDSALAFQEKVESGEEKIVGVNAYKEESDAIDVPALERPSVAAIEAQIARVRRYKEARDQAAVRRALDSVARAANAERENVYAAVVDAARAGVTHGEICHALRRELGFGDVLVVP